MKETSKNRILQQEQSYSKQSNNVQESRPDQADGEAENDKKEKKKIIPEEIPVTKAPLANDKKEGATTRVPMTMFPYES